MAKTNTRRFASPLRVQTVHDKAFVQCGPGLFTITVKAFLLTRIVLSTSSAVLAVAIMKFSAEHWKLWSFGSEVERLH